MPKRRGPGEGSIYQRQDGRWVAEIYVSRDSAGKRRSKYFYGATQKEVLGKRTRALSDRQRGLPVDPDRQTVKDFLTRWLADSVKGKNAPRTHESYSGVVNRHIIPAIGHLRLTKLTPQHLQHLYQVKQEEGLTRAVRLMHAVLHRALDQALRWGLVYRNVADAVDAPRVTRREMQVLSPEQAGQFLDASRGDRLHALYVLAIGCGLRQGELLGLKWADVDWDNSTLQVQRQLQYMNGEFVFSEPKSQKARRTVALPALAVAALKTHKAKQAAERLALGPVWEDNDLVFTSEAGAPLHKSSLRIRSFNPILERAGVPKVRFHDLRHTAATLLLARGVHPKLVQEQLGHSQISLTLDTYSHVLPTMKKDVAAQMDAILTAHGDYHQVS